MEIYEEDERGRDMIDYKNDEAKRQNVIQFVRATQEIMEKEGIKRFPSVRSRLFRAFIILLFICILKIWTSL